MRVLVSDKFPSEGLQVLEQAEGIELDYQPGLTTEQLLGAVAEVDALIVRSGTAITEEIFQAANKLQVIGRAGVGTRNLDLEAANRKGVVVMHTPFGSTTTTAEHTIAMIFALARQIPAASQSTKKGEWESDRFLGIEVAGKTLGVLGAGLGPAHPRQRRRRPRSGARPDRTASRKRPSTRASHRARALRLRARRSAPTGP